MPSGEYAANWGSTALMISVIRFGLAASIFQKPLYGLVWPAAAERPQMMPALSGVQHRGLRFLVSLTSPPSAEIRPASTGPTAPWVAVVRVNAIHFPSGDQIGSMSMGEAGIPMPIMPISGPIICAMTAAGASSSNTTADNSRQRMSRASFCLTVLSRPLRQEQQCRCSWWMRW